ncbi:MAG: hypothetical protein EOO45_00490 [Flavobacterium sp.]|nr:MAG: hypothetical protein EOO45_00490 [Flavobacterium sp.]
MKKLMNYLFYPTLIVRTPAKPYTGFNPDILEALLLTEDFQYALSLASPNLFFTLKNLEFKYSKLSPKLQLAVYRYYNRMSFRPTPFGAFASVATTCWSALGQPLVRSTAVDLIVFKNFDHSTDPEMDSADSLVYVNPSLYRAGDQLRFIFRQKQHGKRATFKLMSIPRSKPLAVLLKKLEVPASHESLIKFLCSTLAQNDPAGLLGKLVHAQVLLRGSENRITGFFKPLTARQSPDEIANYSLAFHHQQGSLSDKYKSKLRDALYALDKLASSPQDNLHEFKQKFSRKFETAELSLLKALDPQVGVGYQGVEQVLFQQGRMTSAAFSLHDQEANSRWRTVSNLLLQKIAGAHGKASYEIALSEPDIANLPGADGNYAKPPSISVMFRIANDGRVFIEQAGGSSAINLAGRFSHDPEILQHLKNITAAEHQNNPEVVFAEIAAADNFFTDNINSRAHLREYEIPVLTTSSLHQQGVITLNDLYVKVVAGRIILFSKRLKRIVIPRLASAYNYQLSNSILLRFLADLQHQALRSHLHFDPEFYLPGLHFYPRISYKNSILSPAKWIWQHYEFAAFSDDLLGKSLFKEKAIACELSVYFALTMHDQQLVFNLHSDQSVSYFLKTIANQETIVLQEYFFSPDADEVRDEGGQGYVNQFIAFLINQKTVYKADPIEFRRKMDSKIFFPGQEWLYFKIYGHPKTIKTLLADPAFERMIGRLLRKNVIRKWFFVNYSDPDEHLRIRLKCTPAQTAQISAQVERWLRNYIKNGFVSDVLVGTYQPELQKYGFADMDLIEDIFQGSSELVFRFHQLSNDANQCNYFGLGSVAMMLTLLFPDLNVLLDFITQNVQSTAYTKRDRIELDKYYRDHRQSLVFAVERAASYAGMQDLMKNCTIVFLRSNHKGKALYYNLVLNLIHMHINRLNTLRVLELEIKIYYWLRKYYLGLSHRK